MLEEMHVVTRHLEHVAALVEYREGTGGWNVFKTNDAAKFVRRNTNARGAADLHGLYVLLTAIFKHLLHADAEGIFINHRPLAVARDR